MEVNIHQAKTNFSRLLQRVLLGEEIIIAKAGIPIARLVPVNVTPTRRPMGLYRGQIRIADDFDDPLPDHILAGFLGEDPPSRKPTKALPAKRRRKA